MMDVSVKEVSESIFDNFKKITPGLIAVAIASGLALFLPVEILSKMALDNIPEKIRRIIGIIFILSISIAAVLAFYGLFKPIITRYENKKLRKNLRKLYTNLSQDKKDIVKAIIHSQNMTMVLDSSRGDIRYLEANKIIYRLQTFTITDCSMSLRFPYSVQAWVMDLYYKEPNLFE